jgi:3-hydroxybutyrate dehydrogenase
MRWLNGWRRRAAMVALLCGPAGADITGSAIPIDGGWSAA